MNRRILSRALAVLCCVALSLATFSPAWAKKADTIKLLPKDTFFYASVTNAPEMADKFMETGFGQMMRDEKLQPVMQQLFGELEKIASPVTDELGLSITDMLLIPRGEITVAVVAQGVGVDPAFVMFAEVNEQMLAVKLLLDKADEELAGADRTRELEEFGGVEITSYDTPGDGDFVYFEKDGFFCITSTLSAARDLIATWESGRSDGFNTNRAFATVVDRGRGPRGERAAITWFVDPVLIVKQSTEDNFFVNNIINGLGVNGLKCAGGTMHFATEDYDTISKFHVIMDYPRPGILNVLAFEPGDATPDPWVPREVGTYMAANFNVNDAFKTVAEMVNRFQGEGFLESQAQEAFRQLDLDFQQDILPAIANRFTYCTWIKKPVTISSQGQLFGLKLKDGANFTPTFEKVVERFRKNVELEERDFAGKKYYAVKLGLQQPDPENNPLGAEQPTPCFMLLNDYIVISDRTEALEEAIRASRGDVETLDRDPDYKLVLETARREAGGEPALVGFSRPEVGLGFLYNLANSDQVRNGLAQASQDNENLAGFNKVLEDNPLPPFEELQKYLAPTGGILVSDETGLHYTSLGLKAKADEETKTKAAGSK